MLRRRAVLEPTAPLGFSRCKKGLGAEKPGRNFINAIFDTIRTIVEAKVVEQPMALLRNENRRHWG
jgi:hypothetical protein